jgi:adenylylsulfate kinase
MLFIQLTGLSGVGKTTISQIVKKKLQEEGRAVEVLDGDSLRKTVNKDLGFSKEDRQENIRRLGALAHSLIVQKNVVIIAAISPFEETRNELKEKYGAKTVWIYCPIETLIVRDPKGLYKRAALPTGHPEKIVNLTGINDVYEKPVSPDLIIDTEKNSAEESAGLLLNFIQKLLH